MNEKKITVYHRNVELAKESTRKSHPGYDIKKVKYEGMCGDAWGNIEYTVTLSFREG